MLGPQVGFLTIERGRAVEDEAEPHIPALVSQKLSCPFVWGVFTPLLQYRSLNN